VTGWADLLLLLVLVLDLAVVATGRIASCIRASALQGVALSLLPIALGVYDLEADVGHIALLCGGTLVVKAVLIPAMLLRAMRSADVQREVEPFISLHLSILLAAALVGVSFWLSSALPLPRPAPSTLLVPIAFSTLLIGFLVLVSRRKAITQVVGYLLLENGIFVFGQTLIADIPFAVELGILLDLLVGVFVMGIAILQIRREFDHIDTELLSTLKD
jgi:hydrogenase-4 component E